MAFKMKIDSRRKRIVDTDVVSDVMCTRQSVIVRVVIRAAFRISAHKLQIERGRYSGQNLEDRLCSACNVVEDESHLFFDCIMYLTTRSQFLQIFNGQNTSSAVSIKDHFISLMTSTDENTLKSIDLFISACNNS